MAILITFSGNIKRFNGSDIEKQHEFSSSKTVTEGGDLRISIASSTKNLSIMPAGLTRATTVYIETDGKINLTLTGDGPLASINLLAGIFAINGSLSDVKLWNQSVASPVTVYYDISG